MITNPQVLRNFIDVVISAHKPGQRVNVSELRNIVYNTYMGIGPWVKVPTGFAITDDTKHSTNGGPDWSVELHAHVAEICRMHPDLENISPKRPSKVNFLKK